MDRLSLLVFSTTITASFIADSTALPAETSTLPTEFAIGRVESQSFPAQSRALPIAEIPPTEISLKLQTTNFSQFVTNENFLNFSFSFDGMKPLQWKSVTKLKYILCRTVEEKSAGEKHSFGPLDKEIYNLVCSNTNKLTSNLRKGKSADKSHYGGTVVYPHVYPYNDNFKSKYTEENHPYGVIHASESHKYLIPTTKEPPYLVQVYPGAYEPKYAYGKLPRTYWMFSLMKGIYVAWEFLQTLAILYLFWKVTAQGLLLGRQDEGLVETLVWDRVMQAIHPQY